MKKVQRKILIIASFAEFGERYGHYIVKSLLIFLFIEKFHFSANNSALLVGNVLGLACVTLNTGLIKSTLPSFIGEAYDKTKASVGERDLGFNLFYGIIIFGAFCALWIASSLKEQYGFTVPWYSSILVSIISISALLKCNNFCNYHQYALC